MNIDTILTHCISAALWSSIDNADESGGQPLDDNYDESDLSPETLKTMREDVLDFVQANLDLLIESRQPEEQIGHDFWLTRNRHGAGFWDRGLGEVGDKLTSACMPYGEVCLYVGADGLIYS